MPDGLHMPLAAAISNCHLFPCHTPRFTIVESELERAPEIHLALLLS